MSLRMLRLIAPARESMFEVLQTSAGRIGPSITTWFLEFAANNSNFDCVLVDLAELGKWATALKTMR